MQDASNVNIVGTQQYICIPATTHSSTKHAWADALMTILLTCVLVSNIPTHFTFFVRL